MILSALAVALTGCNGSESEQPAMTKVSFSVSDAPVDSASNVVVAFDALELVHENGTRYYLDVVDSEQNEGYQQVDLLAFQGSDAKMILSDQEIAVGKYKELIMHTRSGLPLSWVSDVNSGDFELKVPSNKLKLGGFETSEQAVQAFTIEFDLRRALVERSIGSNKGYNLKPHGVTIVDNSAAASLKGQVDVALFSAGDSCDANSGNFVYLYRGHGHSNDSLIDNVDVEYNEVQLPENYVEPYASTDVDDNGQYAFSYLPAGDYTAAFTCNAVADDPEQYNPEIIIANPADQAIEVTLPATQEVTLDFKETVL